MNRSCRTYNLIGQTFGRWTVIESAGVNEHGHTMWLARCKCGNEMQIAGYSNGG